MDIQLLKELTSVSAICGHEDRLIRLVADKLEGCCDDLHIDRLGNVTAVFNGKPGAPTIAYFAHLDELGLIVRRVEENGFLRIERVGGVPEKALLCTQLDVWAVDGSKSYPAVVGTTSHHVTPPDKKFAVTTTSEIFIDMGLGSKAEVEALGVGIGSMITYKPNFTEIGGMIASKALDDRMGVYVMLKMAEMLKDTEHEATVALIFSVQEEFSVRACSPAFNRLMPDAAICLDISPACDTPELKGKYDMFLGKGPAIMYLNFHGRGTLGGLIPNPKLNIFLEQIARDLAIPTQREVVLGVITDDSFTQYLGDEGIPMAHISIPMRYSHSPMEMANAQDIDDTLKLAMESALRFGTATDLSRG